jgi:hypothetical protein
MAKLGDMTPTRSSRNAQDLWIGVSHGLLATR